MNRQTFDKAKELTQQIEWLEKFIRDTRPQFCNGVGITIKNKPLNTDPTYNYNLWSVTPNDKTTPKEFIMQAGIVAMHRQAEIELERLNKELEEL